MTKNSVCVQYRHNFLPNISYLWRTGSVDEEPMDVEGWLPNHDHFIPFLRT